MASLNLRGTLDDRNDLDDNRSHVVSDVFNALTSTLSRADPNAVHERVTSGNSSLSQMPSPSAPPMPAQVPATIDGYAQAFSHAMGAPSPDERGPVGSAEPITISAGPGPAPATTTGTNSETAIMPPAAPAEPSPQRPRQRPAYTP